MSSTTQLESIGIKNYRCFRDIVLDDLPHMTVVVGANGSGKSSLFDVFTFLQDALMQNVASAVARRGGQVFVSTHSPDFLNGAQLNEICWLVKENGFTTVQRASTSDLLQALVNEGDLPGTLWRQGFFKGAGAGPTIRRPARQCS